MAFRSHPHQRATIGNSLDHRLDFGTLQAKCLFHIEWHFGERAASACILDGGCEGLFFRHGLYLSFKFLGTRFFPPIHTPTIVAKMESRKLSDTAVSKRPIISTSSTGKPSVWALIRQDVGISAPRIMPKTPPNSIPVKYPTPMPPVVPAILTVNAAVRAPVTTPKIRPISSPMRIPLRVTVMAPNPAPINAPKIAPITAPKIILFRVIDLSINDVFIQVLNGSLLFNLTYLIFSGFSHL